MTQQYKNIAGSRCIILRNLYDKIDGRATKLYVCRVVYSPYGSEGTEFKISSKYFPKDWKPYENTKGK